MSRSGDSRSHSAPLGARVPSLVWGRSQQQRLRRGYVPRRLLAGRTSGDCAALKAYGGAARVGVFSLCDLPGCVTGPPNSARAPVRGSGPRPRRSSRNRGVNTQTPLTCPSRLIAAAPGALWTTCCSSAWNTGPDSPLPCRAQRVHVASCFGTFQRKLTECSQPGPSLGSAL